MTAPPGSARRVLAWAARALHTPDLVTDADELFEAMVEGRGRRAAGVWYRRQAMLAVYRVLGDVRPAINARGRVERAGLLAGQALRRVAHTRAVSLPFMVVVGLGMGATAFMAQTRQAVMRPDLGLGRPVWRVEAFDRAGGRLPVTFAWTDPWVTEGVGPAGRLLPVQTRTSAVHVEGGALSVTTQEVPGGLLRTVGVRPFAGRDAEAPGEAVASHAFWRAWLAGEGAALGRALEMDGAPVAIVGVAPPEFDGVQCCVRMDLWRVGSGGSAVQRGSALAVGVTDSAASAAAFARVLAGRDERVSRVVLTPAEGAAFGGERGIIGRVLLVLLLLAGVAWVGTVSGAVNLLFADVTERGREMRLRAALGSGRSGPLIQLLMEAGWLTIGAAVVACATTVGLFGIAPRVMPLITPDSVFDLDAGGPAWAALGIAVLSTCTVCGVAAGVVAMRLAVRGGLDRGPRRGRGAAVVLAVQIALATLLVATSAQFLRDVRALDGGMVGFRVAASVFPFNPAAPSARGVMVSELTAHVARETRGRVALTRFIPVYGAPVDTVDAGAGRFAVSTEQVTDGWYDAIGLRVVAGRPARTAAEMVVSADLAARLGSSEAALIGATWMLAGEPVRVTGVAEAATWGTGAPRPTVYRGWPEGPVRFGYLIASSPARGPMSLAVMTAALRDTPYAVGALGTMADLLTRSRLLSVFLARMALMFGGLCLLVALFGVHAQVLRWMRGRERELGIRHALGARPGRLRLFVARAFVAPVGWGVLAGSLAGLAVLRVVRALESGVAAAPWMAIGQASLVVLCTACAAVLLPVVRVRGTSGSELMRDA